MDDKQLTRFREQIGRQRKAAGLTQRQLADAARVSVGVVRDLEQGLTARPRPDSIRRLAAALSMALRQNGALHSDEEIVAGHLPGTRGVLHISILGAITAARDGRSLPLGPARRRAVLGLLAASPRETLSRTRLTEALWGEHPPEHSATMIQSHVSALRRSLDPERSPHSRHGLIISAEPGYRINAARCTIDLSSFHELAAAARAAGRAGRLDEACAAWAQALALWRGDPMGDADILSGHPVVLSLTRLRSRAILDYADAAHRTGRHGDPLPDLEWLAEREPLNERAWAGLMLALAGTGQHAAALDAFRQIRRRLREDLGILPGPDLAAVQLRVLRQQVARDLAEAAPSTELRRPAVAGLPGAGDAGSGSRLSSGYAGAGGSRRDC